MNQAQRITFESIEIIDKIIEGRVTPHIYAFSTNTVPNYLKVGDTYRAVPTRLDEWRKIFRDLEPIFKDKALVADDVFFRDYAVHKFLELDKKRARHTGGNYHTEFFQNATQEDLTEAISDIKAEYAKQSPKYSFYKDGLPVTITYKRSMAPFVLRPLQEATLNNFKAVFNKALAESRRNNTPLNLNLLMYAVMRFGKSFVSLMCAKEMGAKVVVVVSAKADVKDEWKRNVEIPQNFARFKFIEAKDLLADDGIIEKAQTAGDTAVVFLTLQDLSGAAIKPKHKELFKKAVGMLIIDETHFGARAAKYGSILKADKDATKEEKARIKRLNEEQEELLEDIAKEISEEENFDAEIKKSFNAKVKLHLSGTPYRILMSNEFQGDNIISFVQHSDIHAEKEKWDSQNLNQTNPTTGKEFDEWDNPYYGTPQMVRFAFNLNESSRKALEKFNEDGLSSKLSKLFEVGKTNKRFTYEKQVLDLLCAIDGSREDGNVFSFLNYGKIKQGQMARHMVFVLPSRAACDALDELLLRGYPFKNLNAAEYEVLNISGRKISKNLDSVDKVKAAIKKAEQQNKKTITLTVNKMLTGTTVEQWDTMVFLRGTTSPQSYDQAIFRLMNSYVVDYESSSGDKIKINKKPQVLLVDFDPNRMFRLFHERNLIYGIKASERGNDQLEQRLQAELKISPIITLDNKKISEVKPTDIVAAVREYSKSRSVADEAFDIGLCENVLHSSILKEIIEQENELGGKNGFSIYAFDEKGQARIDFDELERFKKHLEEIEMQKQEREATPKKETSEEAKERIKLEKKFAAKMARILFFL